MSDPQRVNLRKSHPGLYQSILIVASGCLALAANFWTSSPTFDPYGVDKDIIGWIFAALGLAQMVFLTVVRSLKMVRITLAITLGWMMFWGLTNTQQSFAGEASFQLPILYVIIALLVRPLLIESPVNPFTEKR